MDELQTDDGRGRGETQGFDAGRERRFAGLYLSAVEHLHATVVQAGVDDIRIVEVPCTTPHLGGTFTSERQAARE